MKHLLTFAIVIMSHHVLCCHSSNKEECAATSYGVLRGKLMTSRSGRVFSAFLGVPYAAPPVGKLRFSPAVPPQPWTGVRNATEEAEVCLQRGSRGSEDCLYLNIFTHSTDSNRNSVVMVYIHGGGFYIGSPSTIFTGPEYLMDRDIVLVTLQYRLGPFGFLSTEDQVIAGNWGLKDQVRALQWVKDNIKGFGGDPEKVTIFGNSAGGASVHFHMKSQLSKGLFTKAISQSGTAYSTFAIIGKGKAKKDSVKLAMNFNCSIESSADILLCLQNKSSSEILLAYEKQLKNNNYLYFNKIFRPVLEDETEEAFITPQFLKVTTEMPWLVGVNANEGLFKIQPDKLNLTIELIKTEFIPFLLNLMYMSDLYTNLDEIANLTNNFYFKNSLTTEDFIKSIEQIVTDSWFVWPTEQAVSQHSGSLYYYLYDHQAEQTYAQTHGCPTCYGVSHTDELIVLFTNRNIPELNEQDSNISKLMVDLWVNFATGGIPTPYPLPKNPQTKDSVQKTIWECSNNLDPKYLHIQTSQISMKRQMFSERIDFWRKLPLRPVS